MAAKKEKGEEETAQLRRDFEQGLLPKRRITRSKSMTCSSRATGTV